MNLYAFNELQILIFFAALVRVGCLLLVMPVFNSNLIPPLVKVLLSFMITFALYPLVQAGSASIPAKDFQSTFGILTIVFREAFVGIVVGFVAKMFFDALNFAFAYMGLQMGFNIASAYDHHQEANVPVISQFVMILVTLIFLAVDGHHYLLKAIAETFSTVPVGTGVASKIVVGFILDTATSVFWIAVKLSAPMALIVFLVNCAFGVIAKAVPQINVLMVSFSVNILVGLLMVLLTIPILGSNSNEVFQQMFERVFAVMGYLHC